ncbi:tetratricopeptide repeat protein [Thermodesulfobacteriota bacterium]
MTPLLDKNIDSRLMAAPSWLYLCILLLSVTLTYSNSIYSPFVLDDFHSFINNPSLDTEDGSLASLKQLSSTKFGKARVIPLATFAIDKQIAAGSVVQYHLTNIIIHLLCTLAVFLLVKSLLLTPVGKSSLNYLSAGAFSVLVAAFWALNPVQTNAVTYVVQRMTSLATFFYVGSLAFYTYGRLTKSLQARVFLFAGAFLTALCAFFSKENSFTLPIAILMLEFFFFNREKILQRIKSVKTIQWIIFIVILILLLPLIKGELLGHLGGYRIRNFSLYERLLTELRVVVFYISLLLLPLPGRLNLEHDFLISESLFSPPATFLAFLLLFFVMMFALRTRRTYPLISFGILWFFLNLAIESTFIPLEIIFEHRLYLSSIGIFITLLSIVDFAAARTVPFFPVNEFKKVFFCTLILLLCLSSILTSFRNNDWRDAITIHADMVNKSPNKARVYNGLGVSLSHAGRNEEALPLLKKGFELDKPYRLESLKIANNIMVVLSEMGRQKEALAWGEQFIKETPRLNEISYMAEFLYNLGALYMHFDKYGYAFDAFLSSFKADEQADFAVKSIEKLLWQYYDDPEASQILGIDNEEKDKNIAIHVRLAEIMYDLRKYERAVSYITVKGNKILNTPKAQEIFSKIQEDKRKNIAGKRNQQ